MFECVTTLDLHQAEFHGKAQLRIRTKEDHERSVEEKKKESISQAQYERMAKKKKEHFPTLNNQPTVYERLEDGKTVDKDAHKHPLHATTNKKALKQEDNFPTLPGGELIGTVSKEMPKPRKVNDPFEVKEPKKKNNRKKVVEESTKPETEEEKERRREEERELRRLMRESVKEVVEAEQDRNVNQDQTPVYNQPSL